MTEAARKVKRPGWIRPGKDAVSPVVGEILMISITITVAGSLFYVISFQPPSESIPIPLGTAIMRLASGNWSLTVTNGKVVAVSAILTITNPDTGAAMMSSPVTAHSWYFVFNDNNGNTFLDGGDSILLNQTVGIIEMYWTVAIVKYNGIISGPLTIPP